MPKSLTVRAAIAAGLTLSLAACFAHQPQVAMERLAVASSPSVSGHVTFASFRKSQALMTEVGNAASVSLIDATTGNTVSSSVTDSSGNFLLTFSNFTPTPGAPYILEAIKGLSVGGNSNRAGAKAVSVRTLLFYNNGWQSLTNTTPGTGIIVSPSTTALCIMTSLRNIATGSLGTLIQSASGSSYIGTSSVPFTSFPADFPGVSALVSNAISLDQDPVSAIGFDAVAATYSLATGVPVITSLSPAVLVPGGSLVLTGSYLDQVLSRSTIWFGPVSASVATVSADRTSATISIPANAYSAPLTLQQPNGVAQVLSPFLMLKGTVGTLAGNGGAGFNNGAGLVAEVNFPLQVALFGTTLLVTDTNNNRLRKLTPGGVMTTFAGNGNGTSLDGVGTSAQFNSPYGSIFDTYGNLFVADTGGYVIRRITPTALVTTFAGSGTATESDGATSSAGFYYPKWVAVDSTGSLYVTDAGNGASPFGSIRMIASPSFTTVTTLVPNNGTLNYPHGIVADAAGNLYVADTNNHVIRKVTQGGVVSVYAGAVGISGSTNGAASSARFTNPRGLAIDLAGNLFVVDTMNHVIRKITPAGVVSTVAGSAQGYADGAISSVQFNEPRGLAVDANGNIYVSDSKNNRIRVITP